MISRISGAVIFSDPRYLIIDVNGVGYKIFTNTDGQIGNEVTLWTYLAVRDSALDLYGFATREELELFELLISVSGVGPKTGLNIMNAASLPTLVHAISQEDTSPLVKTSGIGKKVAEKLILELKGKLPDHLVNLGGKGVGAHHDNDAIEALKALGYSFDEARAALKEVSALGNASTLGTGARVKAALKILGKNSR